MNHPIKKMKLFSLVWFFSVGYGGMGYVKAVPLLAEVDELQYRLKALGFRSKNKPFVKRPNIDVLEVKNLESFEILKHAEGGGEDDYANAINRDGANKILLEINRRNAKNHQLYWGDAYRGGSGNTFSGFPPEWSSYQGSWGISYNGSPENLDYTVSLEALKEEILKNTGKDYDLYHITTARMGVYKAEVVNTDEVLKNIAELNDEEDDETKVEADEKYLRGQIEELGRGEPQYVVQELEDLRQRVLTERNVVDPMDPNKEKLLRREVGCDRYRYRKVRNILPDELEMMARLPRVKTLKLVAVLSEKDTKFAVDNDQAKAHSLAKEMTLSEHGGAVIKEFNKYVQLNERGRFSAYASWDSTLKEECRQFQKDLYYILYYVILEKGQKWGIFADDEEMEGGGEQSAAANDASTSSASGTARASTSEAVTGETVDAGAEREHENTSNNNSGRTTSASVNNKMQLEIVKTVKPREELHSTHRLLADVYQTLVQYDLKKMYDIRYDTAAHDSLFANVLSIEFPASRMGVEGYKFTLLGHGKLDLRFYSETGVLRGYKDGSRFLLAETDRRGYPKYDINERDMEKAEEVVDRKRKKVQEVAAPDSAGAEDDSETTKKRRFLGQ
ncbi:unnamed protein product [Amoebophrya sp. A25]|nr:unnamed protein product [Amoebophrya sp. A25]|eukprot:GSA25T00019187001.1